MVNWASEGFWNSVVLGVIWTVKPQNIFGEAGLYHSVWKASMVAFVIANGVPQDLTKVTSELHPLCSFPQQSGNLKSSVHLKRYGERNCFSDSATYLSSEKIRTENFLHGW